jgi:acyl-CoA dehydrogenase
MADLGSDTVLLDEAERLFEELFPSTEARLAAEAGKWPETAWQRLEEQGFTRALVPEASGGAGLAPEEVWPLLRLAGRHALPLPFAETVIAAGLWARAGGEVPLGPLTLAPSLPGEEFHLDAAGCLHGKAHAIPWGEEATLVLLARNAEGEPHLALLPPAQAPGDERRSLGGDPLPDVEGGGRRPQALRPAPPQLAAMWLAVGAHMRAEQMVGGMERALAYAIEHANTRVQFGRPIGRFQAVQHMIAEAAGELAAATAAADRALPFFDEEAGWLEAAIAKARASEAAGGVAAAAHQVLGAMGFTREHPLHFTTRRLWSWRDEFGDEPYWQAEIGRRVLRGGGEALWTLLVDRPQPGQGR